MKRTHTTWLVALLACIGVAAGCAGLPRIDPTGERLFVFPERQPTTVVTPAFGNVAAPPVYTDPVFPAPALPAAAPTPVVGNVAPAQATTLATPQPPIDRLSVTPQRVLAPIGSEVILRAGYCGADCFHRTGEQIDWLMAREGVGEIVSLGGRGFLQNPLLPWNKPKKHDNGFATGYTASFPLNITRGTADTRDDVQVEPGQAWASITSPVEGASFVTAVAPSIMTWQVRRAVATIYWVDVQWTFPPTQVTGGAQQVLTTTVRRQSDGTPIAGWIVRYEVASGGGTLGTGQSGQVVEVPTNAAGEASIEVTPTGGSGGTTQINHELVRPDRFGDSNMPLLVVARGSTNIAWTGDPYLSPDPVDAGPIPTYPIPGNEPTSPIEPPVTTTPTTPPPSTNRRPVLELQILGPSEAVVGGQLRSEVVIRNVGDGTATGLVLNDRFDAGLSHLADPNRYLEIENANVGDLAPGLTRSVFLTFDVTRPGQLCQTVTVTSREGAQQTARQCINATQPEPEQQPGLEVRLDGPEQHVVGETALFNVVVKNTGEMPLTNLEVVAEFGPELQPRPAVQNYELSNGRIIWRLAELAVGQAIRYEVECQCLAANSAARGLVKVTADTGTSVGAILRADEHVLDILRPRGGTPPGQTPPDDPAAGNLAVAIVSFAETVTAGARATYQIVVENRSTTPDKQVEVRVVFPPNLTPDPTLIQAPPNVAKNVVGNEVLLGPIAEIRPAEQVSFTIPVNINNQPGVVQIGAQVRSQNMPQAQQAVQRVEIRRQ